jgi:ubiquinone/menaquinone biosynthesis C-methylase UbiE
MEISEKWDESHKRIPKDKDASEYAIDKEKEFKRGSTVLDLGGGTGADAFYFVKRGHYVTVADISPYALSIVSDKSKSMNLPISIKQITLGENQLPISSDTFDIVYSRLSLHYFNQQTTVEIIKEINRILKVGGRAFLTLKSPNDEKEMEYLKKTATEIEFNVFNEDKDIKSRYSINQLRQILSKAKIFNLAIKEYSENLGGRIDKVKSGNQTLLLNEIFWEKV